MVEEAKQKCWLQFSSDLLSLFLRSLFFIPGMIIEVIFPFWAVFCSMWKCFLFSRVLSSISTSTYSYIDIFLYMYCPIVSQIIQLFSFNFLPQSLIGHFFKIICRIFASGQCPCTEKNWLYCRAPIGLLVILQGSYWSTGYIAGLLLAGG